MWVGQRRSVGFVGLAVIGLLASQHSPAQRGCGRRGEASRSPKGSAQRRSAKAD